MRRRECITLIGGAAVLVAWPLAVRAQQSGMPVVGFINSASAQSYKRQLAAFLQGLSEAGYVDGRNVTIKYHWADGRSDRLPAMVADLVRRQVAVIAATSSPAALAAKASGTTIPIVFETGGDPIRLGLVDNLNRPGGNITGITQLSQEMTPKRLQLLHELLPTATSMALLVNPAESTLAENQSRELLSTAHKLGLQLHVLNASREDDFDAVFAKLSQLQVGGLVIGGDPFFTSQREQLGALALRYAVPAVHANREFAAAGGLLSHGADITDAYRLAGNYTGRILKGDKPADLPIQQATTKVELYINQKTAKALGLTVPQALLSRADDVIE
jgi:ABC-type uncharacterized transport system substrate-binding protein